MWRRAVVHSHCFAFLFRLLYRLLICRAARWLHPELGGKVHGPLRRSSRRLTGPGWVSALQAPPIWPWQRRDACPHILAALVVGALRPDALAIKVLEHCVGDALAVAATRVKALGLAIGEVVQAAVAVIETKVVLFLRVSVGLLHEEPVLQPSTVVTVSNGVEHGARAWVRRVNCAAVAGVGGELSLPFHHCRCPPHHHCRPGRRARRGSPHSPRRPSQAAPCSPGWHSSAV